MGDGFTVRPDQLRSAGAELAGVGTGLDGQTGQLRGDASIWGADDEGSAFGSSYTEVASAAQEAMRALVAELGSVGERMTAMADDYDTLDGDSAGSLRSIGGQA